MKEIIRGCKSSIETENRFVMSSLSRYHSAPSTFFDNFLDPQQHKEPDRASEIINLLFSDDFAPLEASVLTRQRVEASHEYQGMIPRLASVDEHQILAVQEETFSRDSQDFQDFQESSYGHGGHSHSHSHSHGSHARVKSEQIELSQPEHIFPEFSIPNSGLNSCWMKKEHEQYEQFGIEKGISTLEIQSHVKMENKPARLGGLLRQTSSPADFFASYIPENRNTQDSVTRLGIPQFSVDPSSPDSDGMQSYATRKRFRIPELPLPPSPHQQQDHGLWLPPQASSPTEQFNCSSQFRAKRGFATHPRSVAERIRRSRISERIKKLQEVVPNLDKQTNTAEMLEEAVEYVKFLQKQVELLSNRGRGRGRATSLY